MLRALPFALGLMLTGCLPEDEISAIQCSGNGRWIAFASERLGLCIGRPSGDEFRTLLKRGFCGHSLAWSKGSSSVIFSTNPEGSWEIAIASVDGATTMATRMPSRESDAAFLPDGSAIYVSTISGQPALYKYAGTTVIDAGQPVAGAPGGVWNPALSPDGSKVACFGFDRLRPQIYLVSLKSGQVNCVTSESQLLSLQTDHLVWSPDGLKLVFLRQKDPAVSSTRRRGESLSDHRHALGPATGTKLCQILTAQLPHVGVRETVLIDQDREISMPYFTPDGNVVGFVSENNLARYLPKLVQSQALPLSGLDVTLAAAGPPGSAGLFVAGGQILGVADENFERPRFLTFTLEDKLVLAEEYFRSGALDKAYQLYEEIVNAVESTRDPVFAHFVYAANLRRLGKTKEAVSILEQMIKSGETPAEIAPETLWKVIGYCYLLELDDIEAAKRSFHEYQRIMTERTAPDGSSTTTPSQSMDGERPSKARARTESGNIAANVCAMLDDASSETARLFAKGMKARLDGNAAETDKWFGLLLDKASSSPAVQREYLRARNGYDREVYFYSPAQRKYEPTNKQQSAYLERFLQSAPLSEWAGQARLDLFLLRIEGRDFRRARELLTDALSRPDSADQLEGITEVFANYIESPELQPWLDAAMAEVFLHPEIRSRLDTAVTVGPVRYMMKLAATKMALVQQALDRTRSEADGALSQWQLLSAAERTPRMNAAYARLLAFRAREAELRGLFGEAASLYNQAQAHIAATCADDFELHAELEFRSELVSHCLKIYPHWLPHFLEADRLGGDDLINPTWQAESLTKGLNAWVAIYDAQSTDGVEIQSIGAYHAGVLLEKLGRTAQARAAFMEASAEGNPLFLKKKAQFELAALDEQREDFWNGSRWMERAASGPASGEYQRPWLSYNIARLHLKLNYQVRAARDALAGIVSTRPATPLAVQAEELLAATSN